MFQLTEELLKPHQRVCSRHFPDGNPLKEPDLGLGKHFASPGKKGAPRTKRTKLRQQAKELNPSSASSSLSVTPVHEPCFSVLSASPPPLPETPLTALAGEQLEVDYQVHELPGDVTDSTVGGTTPVPSVPTSEDQHLVSAALVTRIEVLEAENSRLKACLSSEEEKRTAHIWN